MDIERIDEILKEIVKVARELDVLSPCTSEPSDRMIAYGNATVSIGKLLQLMRKEKLTQIGEDDELNGV